MSKKKRKRKKLEKDHKKKNKYEKFSKVDKEVQKLKLPEVDAKQRREAERSYREAMKYHKRQ